MTSRPPPLLRRHAVKVYAQVRKKEKGSCCFIGAQNEVCNRQKAEHVTHQKAGRIPGQNTGYISGKEADCVACQNSDYIAQQNPGNLGFPEA